METNKIINDLKSIFKKDKTRTTHGKALAILLKKLEKKERKIKSDLDYVNNKKKEKKLKIDLKIVRIQLRKGYSKLNNK